MDIISIISAIGITGWIITDFSGGMLLYLFAYRLIIVPIILLYIYSFIGTNYSLIKNKGINYTNKIRTTVHIIVIVLIVAFNLYHSEIFRSDKVMTAILKDDLFHYRLVFRKNGKVENRVYGFLGYSKTYHGKYLMEDNLIIFTQKPYDNNFIPDTLFIDKSQNALFMDRFTTKKEWLNHFKIQESNL